MMTPTMKATDWTDQTGRMTLRSLFSFCRRLRDLSDSMPVTQVELFVFVALNEGKTQADINKTLGYSTSAMSNNIAALSSVNRLTKGPGLGFITWVDHPTDRRARLLTLTPKGRAFLLQIIASL